MDEPRPWVEVRGLCKSYGDHQVLDRVDLDVYPSEVLCLIGRSGSGKSTLLRCLNRLESFDAGRVRIGEHDLGGDRLDIDRLRREVGMVFQSFNLFHHLDAVGNIGLAPRLVLGLSRQEAEERALALLDKVGLREKARAYPSQLSGGQKQRVAIARALAMSPRLLLFDEPTSALDPEMIGEVLDVMSRLAAEGMTMVVVTHEMGFARAVADRVCFLEEGRIVEVGPPAQVFDRARDPRTRVFLGQVGSWDVESEGATGGEA